jgi:hypothetical protein
MVAGIFEKSNRLRKVLVFAIQKTPNFRAAEGCDRNADMGRQQRQGAFSTGGLAKKRKGTLEDRSPRERRIRRTSSLDMYLSAPVSKGLFRPAARETACRSLGRDLLHIRRLA